MKLSCASPMVPGSTLTEKAIHLKEWGYEGIALFLDYREWNKDLKEEVLKLEARTGIQPCEFVFSDSVYGHLMDADPVKSVACREMYKKASEMAAELGAVTELEFEYKAQDPLPCFDPFLQPTPQEEEAFLRIYRELLKNLEGSGGKLLLEDINRYESRYYNRLSDCSRVVDLIDHPNAGILADLFHMSIEEADMAAALMEAGSRISHVHLGDNNRLLPGYGSTDFRKMFSVLKRNGYKGFINLECSTCGDPEKTLPGTAEYMKQILNEV